MGLVWATLQGLKFTFCALHHTCCGTYCARMALLGLQGQAAVCQHNPQTCHMAPQVL